jgi:serine/threonine protein kinase
VETRAQESLGRYQIEAEIGRGAMGVVYRARDPKIDRLVAIKTISLAGQEPQDEEEYCERFLQEARAAGRLSHPGIVTIFDAGEDPKTHEPYLVMEYVSGRPLSKILLVADRRLPVETALHYILEIAEALNYAHGQGVIHRDIKPANILITEDGHAKIADFGVARLNHVLTTHSGQIFGSPAYMAPEQLTMGHADARSDLFSVGVMLYSMLTGFRPFQGNSAETVCFKVMNVEPVPVTSFQAELHPGLDRVVSKAIAKDPDVRYQSGSALAKDIREFLASNATEADAGDSLATWIPQSALPRELGLSLNPAYLKQLAWRAALAAGLIAALLTTWQVRKDMRAVAEIQPPPPQVPSAPAIQKTPIAHHHPRKTSPHPKVETSPAAQMARVHVEILHHFTAAKASVWMDNEIMLDENLHGDDQRHPLLRTLEMNQTANFDISAGKHQVQVRVVTPDNTYDQSKTLQTDLAPGSKHVLHVNCDKRKMLVALQSVGSTANGVHATAPKIEKQPFRAAASSTQPPKP